MFLFKTYNFFVREIIKLTSLSQPKSLQRDLPSTDYKYFCKKWWHKPFGNTIQSAGKERAAIRLCNSQHRCSLLLLLRRNYLLRWMPGNVYDSTSKLR